MTSQFDQADNINPKAVYEDFQELLDSLPATPNRTLYLMNGGGAISSHSYHMTDDRSAKVWHNGSCNGFDVPTYKSLRECGCVTIRHGYWSGCTENYRLLVH